LPNTPTCSSSSSSSSEDSEAAAAAAKTVRQQQHKHWTAYCFCCVNSATTWLELLHLAKHANLQQQQQQQRQ
jgi:hypothetical protein